MDMSKEWVCGLKQLGGDVIRKKLIPHAHLKIPRATTVVAGVIHKEKLLVWAFCKERERESVFADDRRALTKKRLYKPKEVDQRDDGGNWMEVKVRGRERGRGMITLKTYDMFGLLNWVR